MNFAACCRAIRFTVFNNMKITCKLSAARNQRCTAVESCDQGGGVRRDLAESCPTFDHVPFNIACSIKKIKLRNFMVHSFIELDCSSRINLILGANGSGKSSIVCAICLGLGGDPGNMNRDGKLESVSRTALPGHAWRSTKSDQYPYPRRHLPPLVPHPPPQYVKTGKNMAEIEITVMGPPGKGDYRITRVIRPKKEGDPTGVTHWWINGVKVKQEEIRDLMNELHIQMDNPCQFLPQELVSDFTSLDPVKLLRKTELAIDTTLHDRHTQLIRDGKQHEEGTSLLTRLQTNLENVRAEKAGLEGDVAAFAEMEKMKVGAIDDAGHGGGGWRFPMVGSFA